MDLVVVFFVICVIGWLRKGWALATARQRCRAGAGPGWVSYA
jgi:hypothetical protein